MSCRFREGTGLVIAIHGTASSLPVTKNTRRCVGWDTKGVCAVGVEPRLLPGREKSGAGNTL
eukprot:6122337-Prymnesium_polylepis.1